MIEATDEVREITIRRTTKLELGLVAALIINVGAIVGFAFSMVSKVDTVISNMNQLRDDVKTLSNGIADMSVLRYRVEQLERQVSEIQKKQP